MRSRWMLAGVAVIAAAGCSLGVRDKDGGPLQMAGQIQMNDVSILFPLTASYSTIDAAYLAASAAGDHGVLLPEAVYDAAGHISGSTKINSADYRALYKDLHVVAIRIDPCFATLQPDLHGAGCTSQVRLVLQELTATSGPLVANPSALHAFYEISRADLVALTRAIVALRVASTSGERLGGLAPHPIIITQGLDGAFASGVRDLILRYAGADSLTRVTELTDPSGVEWSFLGFEVVHDIALARLAIPTLGGSTFQGYLRSSYDPVDGRLSPSPTSPDSFTPLTSAASAVSLSTADAQVAFDGLVRVDNPTRNSQHTIDCGSCHLATPASLWVANRVLGYSEAENAYAYHPDGTWVQTSEMSPTFASAPSMAIFNIHAFSYTERTPGISQRTVNETAAIVAYLNTSEQL